MLNKSKILFKAKNYRLEEFTNGDETKYAITICENKLFLNNQNFLNFLHKTIDIYLKISKEGNTTFWSRLFPKKTKLKTIRINGEKVRFIQVSQSTVCISYNKATTYLNSEEIKNFCEALNLKAYQILYNAGLPKNIKLQETFFKGLQVIYHT
ncbi:MAG: hypothetical protein MK193_02595 [Lentisphaeria bacterium]|nr:hypothetical protein [Lentisphaeria bacterium]